MYKYKPKHYQPQIGDIVQWPNLPTHHENRTSTKYYLVEGVYNNLVEIRDDTNSLERYGDGHDRRILETKPSSETKVEDTCIVIEDHIDPKGPKKGTIFKVTNVTNCTIFTDIVGYGSNTYGFPKDSNRIKVLQPKDKPMTKLSDFLKDKGIYEKFLTNLDSSYYNYQNFINSDSVYDALCNAFAWSESPEGHDFWEDTAESIDASCINDVRAPNDVDYWEDYFQAGDDVWVLLTTDEILKCKGISPKGWANPKGFYSENPTWLLQDDIGVPYAIKNNWSSCINTLSDLYDCASATTETLETTITKEQPMNTNIEIKVNGETIKTETTAKPKSDYKKRSKVIAEYYSSNGTFIKQAKFDTIKAAQDELVNLLGSYPNAKVVPYTMGKSSKIKHQFTVA